MPVYIHELSDWPIFFWQEEIISPLLASVRHRQGRLIGRMEALGFQLQSEAVLQSLTDDVVKTSEIEGEVLSKDQVRSSIARRLGMDIGGLVPADRHVEGIVELMLDATQNYDDALSVERLFNWHAALFPTGRSGMTRIRIGAWRDDAKGPMQVISGSIGRERVHYQAPAASKLNTEMDAFFTWFNRGDVLDPVIKAGLSHLWFITLHPFEDGNGRIARAITDMALARSEKTSQRFYSMSAQIRLERKTYYDTLEQVQKGTLDVTHWLQWFLGCLDRAFDGAETSLAAVLAKAQFWERHSHTPLNARQRNIINRLLDGFAGKLTSSKWAKLTACSQDTALRDIDDLVRRGVLAKEQAGGRSTSYVLVA